jgi:hypothetical protein
LRKGGLGPPFLFINLVKTMKKLFTLLLAFVFASFGAFAQEEAPAEGASKDDKKPPKEKSYADIITSDAVTDSGLFIVHQVKGKYYFEIPVELLEREILVVSRIAGYVNNLSFGGAGMRSRPQQVIRWQQKDNKILLRSVSYSRVADPELPIYQSVRNNNYEPVVMSFDRVCYNADSSALVFDPTALFTGDVAMIGPMGEDQRKNFGIKGLESKSCFINYFKSFPENTEVRHVLTFKGDKLPDNRITGLMSVEMNQSFILLPAEPMEPRLYDDRVGYFSLQQVDFGLDEHKAARRRYITRWRLEPKDVEAYKRGELVEPVKPIVYYIDPATPEEWRPFLKQGVEDWQSAFEKAGFKNAIIAKDPPSKEEDPDWSPEDVRYSVIRYVATEIQNAMGPHVHDPRTGEILESDIIWYHNVMNLLRNWFFIQTSAVNPEAQRAKFSDELMGQLIRFVSAHEVGHTLGLPHNMGSSCAYHVDSLRAPGFVQRMGVAPSIMDYARFNYVAQPEDKGVGLFPKIGPYDDWSIIFGYKYFPDNQGPDAEKPLLHQMVLERAGDPLYRYGRQQGRVLDPSAQTEDIGHDAVMASDLGIANLKRTTAQLMNWAVEDEKDYAELRELYGQVIGQLRRYTGHVGNNVGGIYEYSKTGDQEGPVYIHTPRERQAAAVQFLNRQIFQTPSWLLDQNILSRIAYTSAVEDMRSLHAFALGLLFDASRIQRMTENEALNGRAAYPASSLFDEVSASVFSEVKAGKTIDPYRRNLQRAYVDRMGALMQLSGDAANQSDVKALARGSLSALKSDLKKNAKKQKDAVSRYHLEDLVARITLIEEGKAPAPAASPSAPAFDEVKGCFEE